MPNLPRPTSEEESEDPVPAGYAHTPARGGAASSTSEEEEEDLPAPAQRSRPISRFTRVKSIFDIPLDGDYFEYSPKNSEKVYEVRRIR